MAKEKVKKTKKTMMYNLVSSEGKGQAYVVKKKNGSPKLELKKYDNKLRRHVLFTEQKIKTSNK
jgi:large subunit ribosomal protein L33